MLGRWDVTLCLATGLLLEPVLFRKIAQSVAFPYNGRAARGCVAYLRRASRFMTRGSCTHRQYPKSSRDGFVAVGELTPFLFGECRIRWQRELVELPTQNLLAAKDIGYDCAVLSLGRVLSAAPRPHFPARVSALPSAPATDARPAWMVAGAPMAPIVNSMPGPVAVSAIAVVIAGRRDQMASRRARAPLRHGLDRYPCSLA